MSPRRPPDRRTSASLASSTEHVTAVEGVVCIGRRRGRTLGFPTANLTASGALPEDGVYAGRVAIDDEPAHRPALVTVGTSPTFGDVDRRVEAHLLDFDGDLYGSRLRIVLVTRLGPVRRFASADALAAAIRHFAGQARAILSPDAKEEPTWN